MTTAEERVAQARGVAAALLELVEGDPEGQRWTPVLRDVVADLDPGGGDAAPDALRAAHDRYGSILGGMGSFNDYWIPDRDDRLDDLRGRLRDLLQLDEGLLTGEGADPKGRTCPVCGYPSLFEPPRSRSGGASYEICPSCGFQFGVSDDDEDFTYEGWRGRWVAGGMPWSSVSIPRPPDWDPAAQLARLLDRG